MNKQTAQKADFLIQGLLGRLDDGAAFFEGIQVVFVSGTKEFPLQAEWDDDALTFFFSGERHILNREEFRRFIAERIPEYDKMTLTYQERGKRYMVFADNKTVSTKSVDAAPEKVQRHSGSAVISAREYYINPQKAAEILQVIGIMGQNGKVKNDMIRKYNQIDHFVELLDPLLRELADKKETIHVVDCGCGKSYLSFVLNYYIKEVLGRKCYFTGLDFNETVIADSRKMAQRLRYHNMEFVETDIMNYVPNKRFDLLLTLHACDTATDKALSFGLRHDVAAMVCVPCCHREMNAQYHLEGFEDILKYGVLKARIADSLTDGMRAMYLEGQGYDVSLTEYISPLDTPKNLMMKALKKRRKDQDILDRFYALEKALGTDLSIKY